MVKLENVSSVRCSLMEASLVVLNIAFVQFLFRFCTAFVPLLYRFCIYVRCCTVFVKLLYRFCTYAPFVYCFCTSLEKDCFNIATNWIATKKIATKRIATKGIATKRIATKGIATKRIATKGIATKGIAFPDLSDLSDICEKHMFYKIGHNSGPRGSPDMILTAFDVKFNKKKVEIPPRACRPSK